MSSQNRLANFVAKRRWLKRLVRPYLPEISSIRIQDKIDFHYDPKDICGPSFHVSYDTQNGFLNYEETSKNELLALLPEEGVLFDIGANIGLFTFYFALSKPKAKIFSFEPNTLAYTCLSKTKESINHSNITLINKAVGNTEQQQKLYRSSINDGGHTLTEEYIIEDKSVDDFEVVSIINLDQRIEKGEFPAPDVIKIDVEGFELEVLKGIEKSISLYTPKMLIECANNDLAGQGPLWKFLQKFEAQGLRVRIPGQSDYIDFEQLTIYASSSLREKRELENYFFCFQ